MEFLVSDIGIKLLVLIMVLLGLFTAFFTNGFFSLFIVLIGAIPITFTYYAEKKTRTGILKKHNVAVVCESKLLKGYTFNEKKEKIIDENGKEYDIFSCSIIPEKFLKNENIICKTSKWFGFVKEEYYLTYYSLDIKHLKIIDKKTNRIFNLNDCY